MRMKALSKKEVIDVENGEKLGVLGRADLIIDPDSGMIKSLVILNQGLIGFGAARKELTIDWHQIKTIGDETILLKKQ
ncbi:YlmC/YmxH family sporulation protein [Halobacillus litoralis]|uniref:YlmC/YmxH family sporulation protein n=1 Tax=Halobacillus litoralis TaxID=45668 RepID=A0A410MIM0_9BACI|nr:YlmC/YmxH family sporulation protein [Halobacillus litoralis]QAS54528.1 YlmC/YmxH family sporulation protein [Halobacillus litoralis]